MKTFDDTKRHILHTGTVIPAHPLALTPSGKLDERRQRALSRYYVDAGAGGIAVAVHSTQFEIREPEHDLLKPVLELATDAVSAWTDKPIIMIAGVVGNTRQAVKEATLAADLGYDAVLLSMAAFKNGTVDEMIAHAQTIADIIPVIGFYLQPSVGGRILPYAFWRRFADIDNVIAIKMAPFNRYQTLDVVRGVCESKRRDDIALYTGNDDNIVVDLLTEYEIIVEGTPVRKRIVGGLLGHWCVWTKRAVELLRDIHDIIASGSVIPPEMLTRATKITDSNAALFDPAHAFAGCIPGIHRVLERQGLMAGRWCLNPEETLSPGQFEEIERIYADYPDIGDDEFVKENLERWLAD